MLQQSSTVFVSFYVAISLPTSLSDIFGKKSFDLQARRQAPTRHFYMIYGSSPLSLPPPPPPPLHGLARGEGKLRRRERKDDFWKDFWEAGRYLSVRDSMVIVHRNVRSENVDAFLITSSYYRCYLVISKPAIHRRQ